MMGQNFNYRPLNLENFAEGEFTPLAGADGADAEEVAAPEAEPELPPEPSFSEEELEAAKAEAFAKGKEAGLTEGRQEVEAAAAEREQQIIEGLGSLNGRLEEELAQFHALQDGQKRDMAKLALLVAQKMTGQMMGENPLSAIETMVSQCLEMLHGKQKISIAVHAELVEPLERYVKQTAGQREWELHVVPDDTLIPGDCRIEWAGGSAHRDQQALWEEMEKIITRAMNAPKE